MQKSKIGVAALVLAAFFAVLTAMHLVLARLTDEESRASTQLKRETCLAQAIMPADQARCRSIEPETGFVVARLPIPGFFAITTLMALGFGLAMLAKPDADKPADIRSISDRERQRRLTLAAQEKLREERARREGAS